MLWNSGIFGSSESINYSYILLNLVYQHEMAHWHLGKFNDETRMQYIGRACQELMGYLESFKDNADVYDSLHSFLNGEVQLRWGEEIAAAIMSYINVMSLCSSPAEKKYMCVNSSLLCIIETAGISPNRQFQRHIIRYPSTRLYP